MTIEKNGMVSSCEIVLERGFILSVSICFDFGGSGQCFGGYVLGGLPDGKSAAGKHADQMNLMADWVGMLMWITEVEKFSDIKGKILRVRKEDEWGKILAIGHPYKNRWLDPETLPTMVAMKERGQ
jgi:hypothetical protein